MFRSFLFFLTILASLSSGLGQGKAEPGKLPPPETAASLYARYAKSSPTKGLNEQEFEAYLADHLSPDPETAANLAALYAEHSRYYEIMKPKIEEAWTRVLYGTGTPSTGVIDRIAFGEYLKKYPPGSALPTLPVNPPAAKSDILARISGNKLHASDLHITKSASQAGSSGLPGGIDPGPAQFNWSKAAGSSSVFSIDGALSYNYQANDWLFLTPSVEAHTSSDSSAQQDSIKASLSIKDWITKANPTGHSLFAGHILSIAPAYETDRKKQTETFGGEFFYTPILNLPGMEGYQRLDFWRDRSNVNAQTPAEVQNNVYPGFSWTSSVGMEGGYASQKSSAAVDLHNDYARFVLKVHVDLYLTPRFDVAMNYTERTFLTDGKNSFSYVEVSPIWYLDSSQEDPKKQNFAVGLTYKYGNTTPQFTKVDAISAWFGIKF